jgi:peptide/nickel transport system substrate-binding protein
VLLGAAWLIGPWAPAWGQQSGPKALEASGLVGEIEGVSLVLDPVLWPTRFQEAPELAEMVKAGRLPPVAQRLPDEPLVIKPLADIGRYGGTWRRGFIGPSDGENGNRINASDKLVFWDAAGTKIVPSLAKSWEQSADGRSLTLKLRSGLK